MTATKTGAVSAHRAALQERALPAAGLVLLESVHQHRLVSVAQLHELHRPGLAIRRTQTLVEQLHALGLIRFVHHTRATRLWFLSRAGSEAIELLSGRVEPRRKLITPTQAAGPLRHHTLAVNDVGVAFVRAARAHGDDCGPLSWRHEIAHPIGRSRHERLIVDALLTYVQHQPARATVHRRFVELDRATTPVNALADKLARYAALHHYTPGREGRAWWRSRYPAFPAVHVFLTGDSRVRLQARLEQTIALCHQHRQLTTTGDVRVSFALLEDLQRVGPFATRFIDLHHPERVVDWLGNPASERGGAPR